MVIPFARKDYYQDDAYVLSCTVSSPTNLRKTPVRTTPPLRRVWEQSPQPEDLSLSARSVSLEILTRHGRPARLTPASLPPHSLFCCHWTTQKKGKSRKSLSCQHHCCSIRQLRQSATILMQVLVSLLALHKQSRTSSSATHHHSFAHRRRQPP